ncbi:hypothetical protein ACVXZ4_11460 [Lacisediminihabitans sp. FW035]
MTSARRLTSALLGLGIALVAVLGLGGIPAVAATPPIGSFPVWTKAAAGTFDATFSAASAFPSAHVVTTDTGASIASGKSAFLGATTGFGQTFGSTRLQPYLTIASLGASTASTTTITFASATPVGWGFAVGDIDADYVSLAAAGPGGAVTSAQFGAQNTNNVPFLNYCRNASPRPTPCPASGEPYADVPAWCAGVIPVAPCLGKPADSVVGNGSDTAGSYDWFIPTVPVSTLTLTFLPLSGLPNFQLWLVAPAPAAAVTGTISLPASPTAPVPAGTAVELLDAAGTAVPDIQGDPVTAPVASTGVFSLVAELGDYQLQVIVPAGFTAPAPVPFTAAADTVDLGTLAIAAVAAAAPAPAPAAADPALAPTGTAPGQVLAAGFGLVGLGAALLGGALLAARRRGAGA